jgi:hypothetical protein
MSITIAGPKAMASYLTVNYRLGSVPFEEGVVELDRTGGIVSISDWKDAYLETTRFEPNHRYILFTINLEKKLLDAKSTAADMKDSWARNYIQLELADSLALDLHNGVWVSGFCDDQSCCPDEGRELYEDLESWIEVKTLSKEFYFSSFICNLTEQNYFDSVLLENLDVRDAALTWLEQNNNWSLVTNADGDGRPAHRVCQVLAHMYDASIEQDHDFVKAVLADMVGEGYSLAGLLLSGFDKGIFKALRNGLNDYTVEQFLEN